MKQRMLGFFSGFPDRRFPKRIAEKLKEALAERRSIVFVSAWPEDHDRNDSDLEGMYHMFLDWGMDFEEHSVIDSRSQAKGAQEALRRASCVFLMGGHPGLQMELLREKSLDTAIQESCGAVLGVSAGAINMAVRSLDTKESPIPYKGLGLADITVKPHFDPRHEGVLSALLRISEQLPICAMEDGSAIFTDGKTVSREGNIHWINKGVHSGFSPENLYAGRKN